MQKKDVIKQVITNLKKKGFDRFNAQISGYDAVGKYSYSGSNKNFQPDMEGFKGEDKYLFSVEGNYRKTELFEAFQRWILLRIFAKREGGTLYIVVPEKDEEKYKTIIAKQKLDAITMTVKGY